jgi:hypothetical protein
MLGEVNLTHTTSAEQALNNVASEDLTVVQRHVRKPTNDKANAYKERGHQTPLDTRRTADRCRSADRNLGLNESVLVLLGHPGFGDAAASTDLLRRVSGLVFLHDVGDIIGGQEALRAGW